MQHSQLFRCSRVSDTVKNVGGLLPLTVVPSIGGAREVIIGDGVVGRAVVEGVRTIIIVDGVVGTIVEGGRTVVGGIIVVRRVGEEVIIKARRSREIIISKR